MGLVMLGSKNAQAIEEMVLVRNALHLIVNLAGLVNCDLVNYDALDLYAHFYKNPSRINQALRSPVKNPLY